MRIALRLVNLLFWRGRRHHHRSHHHHRPLVLLEINGTYIVLTPFQKEHIMVDVTVGHNVACSIIFLDQNGNPMLTAQTPDSPPTWTNIDTTVDTLKVSADGLTCEVDAIKAGADTVNLSVTVGGKAFSAALQVAVSDAPQVLTSVGINAVVS